MEMAGVTLGVAAFNTVLPHVVEPAKKSITDYIRVNKRVEHLVADMDTLKAKRDDRLKELEKAKEDQLGDQTREGEDWFYQVRASSDKVDKIKGKNQNRRFFHIFSTCSVCIGAVEEHMTTKKLLTRESRLNLITHWSPSQPPPRQEMTIKWNLVGGDATLNIVLQCLDRAKDGTTLGLWGMVGVGKSTLLKRIYNTFLPGKPKEHEYDYVIYIKVSKKFTLESLQESLATQLGLRQDSRKERIFSRLKESRFLLLLDDLWQKLDLGKMGIPVPRLRRHGTAEVVAAHDQRRPNPKYQIVFTTNFMEMCKEMKAHRYFELERLNEEEALQLFQEAAGAEIFRSHPNIRILSKKIAALCDGLPKILTSIGENLPKDSAQTILEDWNSEYYKLKNGKPLSWILSSRIYSHYQISYERLNDEWKKKCFLTCSLWPGDRDIPKFELIRCWMGLGLINESIFPEENIDIGNSVTRELHRLHLLEMGVTTTAVRMSHISRSFALSQNFGPSTSRWVVLARAGLSQVPIPAPSDLGSGVECISCMENLIETFPPIDSSCHNLKILVLKGNFLLKEIPSGTLLYMRSLEYLDLSNTGLINLSSDIGELLELRYLNLSWTLISSLPKEMSRLVKLKCLILAHTRNLQNIPVNLLSAFSKLNFLDVIGRVYSYDGRPSRTGRNRWKEANGEINASVSELSCLQKGIKAVGITVGRESALQWLTKQSVSVWHLVITDFRGSSETLSMLSRNLLGSRNIKKNIKELIFSDIQVLLKLVMKYDQAHDYEVQDDQNPSKTWMFERLQVLKFLNLNSLEEIKWDRVVPRVLLHFVRELTIYGCHKLEHISWVLKLPSMECLKVRSCDGLLKIIRESEDSDKFPDFQSLKILILEDLPRLRSICDRSLTFPSLEHLHLTACPSLEKFPFPNDIISGKLKKIRSTKTILDQLMWDDEEVKKFVFAVTSKANYAVAAPPPPPPRSSIHPHPPSPLEYGTANITLPHRPRPPLEGGKTNVTLAPPLTDGKTNVTLAPELNAKRTKLIFGSILILLFLLLLPLFWLTLSVRVI